MKVAKLAGEFVWHKHDDEDELFQVVRGSMRIQVEGQPDVLLRAGEICVIPRGTMHNPVAEEECWIVLIETARTRSIEEQLA